MSEAVQDGCVGNAVQDRCDGDAVQDGCDGDAGYKSCVRWYYINKPLPLPLPLPSKFSMTSTSKCDTLWPRNVHVSYKYACGAEAALSTHFHECTKPTKTSRGKKAIKFTNTESLFYTTSGARLPSGVVSGVIFLLFILLMNYLVVQWMSRWRQGHNLCDLQHKFDLLFLHKL